MTPSFPAERSIDEIRRLLAANRSVVFTAPPGSGKTTCVPPALLDEPWLKGRKIVMLEPRRLAARNCACYMAARRGEAVGGTIGYQVRLERRVSRATRLEIVTEGLLTQRLLNDPELADTGLVIFDEFHERSLACDLSFALALEVRRALRDDLRIMVMSATLDPGAVAAHLGDAATVACEGRMFPVETRYLGDVSPVAAVGRALKETEGDILCFLPGEAEIRRAVEASRPFAASADVLPLFGALAKADQDRVLAPSSRRKVIYATSIAETSLTIEGITCVVDSGLMRVPRFSPATGMSALVTLPLTLDRAEQRRGRAGRVRPGVCYRLWTEASEASRPARMSPEILDADLCSLALTSAAWGALRRTDLPWLTLPPASSWDQATGLLKLLGALDADGAPTEKGRGMSTLPMHPRLANMIALSGGASETACLLAAIIEEGAESRGETDVRKTLDAVRFAPNRPYSRRILRLAERFAAHRRGTGGGTFSEGALLALAYPDRLARNRGNGTFQMVSGRGASLDPSDALAKAPYIVACELDGRLQDARVFLASPIDEEEIRERFADAIERAPFCAWDRREDRVKCVLRERLGGMTLRESPVATAPEYGAQVAAALLDGVRQKGVANLPFWSKESLQLCARANFIARTLRDDPAADWPELTDARLADALAGFVDGMTKWKDLERVDPFAVMDSILAAAGHDRRELERLAPARMEVPSGSHMTIHYEGDEPTVEVRLQECFGLMATPRLVGGRVPVVMTLLSPAGRPVQITKDLAGFWREGYQLVRKDLRGRYPKHYWPEDPFTAVATRRVRPR